MLQCWTIRAKNRGRGPNIMSPGIYPGMKRADNQTIHSPNIHTGLSRGLASRPTSPPSCSFSLRRPTTLMVRRSMYNTQHLIAFWSFGARRLAFKRGIRGFSLRDHRFSFSVAVFFVELLRHLQASGWERGSLVPKSRRIERSGKHGYVLVHGWKGFGRA